MKVGEVMNRQVRRLSPSDTFNETLEVMLRFHLNEVVVVNDEDELVGIVTYSDLARTFFPSVQEFMESEQQYVTNPELMEDRFKGISNVPVEQIMTKEVTTTTPDTPATQAAATMTAHHVKALPVVEDDAVVGIVSFRDVGWGFMMKFMHSARNRR